MSDDSLEVMRLRRRRAELRAERVRIANGYQASIEMRGTESARPSEDANLDRIARELADIRTQLMVQMVLERTVS